MASTNLGRVLLIPKGTWNEETDYSKLDFVTIGGSSYVAKSAVPAGTSVSNTTYWQLLASKGETGGLAQIANEFSTTNTYSAGDYCIYDGDLYRFTEAHEEGAWTGEDVVLVSVSGELARKADLSDLNAVSAEVDTKQDALTFDTAPTASSTNPVESGGVYTALAGKANSSHNHSASDITSGTLPIGRGGTGNTTGLAASATKLATARSLYVNLNSVYDSANPVTFDGSANKGLPIYNSLSTAHGGTGGTDSDWKSLTNASVFSGTIYYRKLGKIVFMHGSSLTLASELTSSSGVTLGSVANGYGPGKTSDGAISSSYFHGSWRVNTSGAIQLFKERSISSVTTSQTFALHIVYLTD